MISDQYFSILSITFKKVLRDLKTGFAISRSRSFPLKSMEPFKVNLRWLMFLIFFFSISIANCCPPPCCVLHLGLAGAGSTISAPFLFSLTACITPWAKSGLFTQCSLSPFGLEKNQKTFPKEYYFNFIFTKTKLTGAFTFPDLVKHIENVAVTQLHSLPVWSKNR